MKFASNFYQYFLFMKKKCFVYLLILLTIVSCNSTIERENDIYSINLDQSLEGKLSDKFSAIEYILLDATDDQPLASPHGIKSSSPDHFFIRDLTTNKIFAFNALGQIEKIYKPSGRGPGEFFQIQDFHTNSKGHIFLHDPINAKIQMYSVNGDFFDENKTTLRSMNFYKSEVFTLFFMSYDTHSGNHNFIKTDNLTEKETEFIKIPEEKANSIKYDSHFGFVDDPFRNELYFVLHYATEVAFFNKNSGNLMRHVHFDFNDYNMPTDIWKKDRKTIREIVKSNNYVTDIDAFIPFQDQYFMYVNQGGKKKHHIFLDTNMDVIYQSYNPLNDLDGMIMNSMPWYFTEDEVIYLKRSSDIYNNYPNVFSDVNSKSNIHEFFNQNNEKLKDDMWVLIKLKVKPINYS